MNVGHHWSDKPRLLKFLAGVIIFIILVLFIFSQIHIKTNNNFVNYNEHFVDDMEASWFWIDITKYVKVSGRVDTSKIGDYLMEYSFLNHKVQRYIHVRDLEPPIIFIIGSKKITLSSMDDYEELGVSVWDNYDGDLTDKVTTEVKVIDSNQIQIIYSVRDNYGNLASAIREIKIDPEVVSSK